MRLLPLLALASGLSFGAAALGAAAQAPANRAAFLAELSVGPLLGLDHPIKGGAGALLLGLSIAPFEAGIRAGAAYDAGFRTGLLRFDLELGLGGDFRAILGGLVPLGSLALPEPSGAAGAVPAAVGPWPNRFGLASTLFELPWRLVGARLLLDAELVYTDFRVAAAPAAGTRAGALSGAAAFAAGVEATLALRLRWDGRLRRLSP